MATTEIETAEPSEQQGDTPIRVLIVEDDTAALELYLEYLSADTRNIYAVVHAVDAIHGARILREQDFDVILLDYKLPTGNGFAFLDAMYASASNKITPVILITGYGNPDIAATCIQRGVDFMPKKNVATRSLRRAIRNAIEKADLQRTIHKQNLDLLEGNQQLADKNDEIRRFFYGISHEIKSPLTAAREFVSLVHDGVVGETDAESRELLALAIESCDQIAGHFNDLVDCVRIDANKLDLEIAPSSVQKVLMRVVTAAAPATRERDVTIEQEIVAGLPNFEFDQSRMVQVLSNLLNNAVKFSSAGDKVVVFARLAEAGEVLEMGVRDMGPGIKQEHRSQIFDRLYQVESRGDEYSGAGLGLGLSIANEIVKQHGGKICVDSEVGVGSTFTVRLPTRSGAKQIGTGEGIA